MKKALDCLNVFAQVSGLRINVKKCDLLPLKIEPLDLNEICEIPVKEAITYLGIKTSKNQEERARLMGKKFDSWLGPDVSPYGRVL